MRKRGERPSGRVRKPRFTPDQSQVLMERTVIHAQQLFGDRMSPLSVRKRIWQEVTQAVNTISKTKRSTEEVQKRWRDERRRIKHRAQDLWQALVQTGVPMGQLTPLEEAVVATFTDDSIRTRLGKPVGPPTPTVPLDVLIQQLKTGIISPEPLGTEQKPVTPVPPTPTPKSILTPPVPVCVDDIKQEANGPEVSDVVQGEWKFEWTVEDSSVVSPQSSEAPSTFQPEPQLPVSAPLTLSNGTPAISNTPKTKLRTKSRTTGSWPWSRLRRQWQIRDLGTRRVSPASCTCKATCGCMVVGRQLRVLNNSVLAVRSELSALVTAVTAIATAMQSHSGVGTPNADQQHCKNPLDQNQNMELTGQQACTPPSDYKQCSSLADPKQNTQVTDRKQHRPPADHQQDIQLTDPQENTQLD
ncbi:hypothetical protein JZ751_001383 [Albula glossodonta]|uniref:Myb/SANT-like DNA-binding domain-containing protein n=1 Tax=Albula glossodonta TaxID=121402 RepID=A0A8T2PTJ3_9TELE|nr:hypothetical protein JZ751_001383 [Albula glossodonta]